MERRQLNLVVDLCGCPNRCLHCWLGHMPNRRMEEGADEEILCFFSPYFEKIAFYSWLREPDYCDDCRQRWERDLALSKNAVPERFELASFYRIVRDESYLPFLQSVGVRKVQLSFFGLRETQDRYVGRKGAFDELLRATELLIDRGMIPRWQCFINEENREEIVQIYRMAQELRQSRCAALEFFVHEGSCEGENRKLYPIRIRRSHIPEELLPVYLDHDALRTERDCCEALADDASHPAFPLGEEITLYISNTYDVYYNFTNMSRPWVIGNLKTEAPDALVDRVLRGDTFALNRAKDVTWAELVARFGDFSSERVFSLEDYKIYLFNNYLERYCFTQDLLL